MRAIYEWHGVVIATGRRDRGIIESDGDEVGVHDELRRKGIEPSKIRTYTASVSDIGKRLRVKTEDHLHFFEQLAFLNKLTLSRALMICAERCTNRRFSLTLSQVAQDVKDGNELHAAMARHPRDFTPLMIALVRAAFEAAAGDEVFQNLADMLEFNYATTADVSDGLRGPLLLLLLGAFAIGVMFVFFVPRIGTMLSAFHVEMPWITRVILSTAGVLSRPLLWVELAVFAILALTGLKAGMRNERFAVAVDRLVRRIPLLGKLLEKRDTAMFARMLAVILKTVNLSNAVQLLVPMARTTLHRLALEDVVRQVKDGVELHEAFEQAGGFDPLFISYLAIGAESTDRPGACLRVAEFLEREVRRGFKALTTKIDPIVSGGITALFLFVAIGLYAAYLQLISQALNNF